MDSGAVIHAVDEVIERARETADELVFVARTEGQAGRPALWFAEDFRYEFEERLVPRLERLKRALREKETRAAKEVAA